MAQPAGVGNAVNREQNIKAVKSITPIVGNNTTEGTGTGVDLKGYESATVLIHIGDSGDTLSGTVLITPSIQESDDDAVTDAYADIPASGMNVVVGDMNVIDAPSEDTKVIQVNLLAGLGRKRWVRVLLTFTGTHTNGTPISAVVLKGHPRVAPPTM